MSKRNKDKQINVNFSEQEMRDIIASVLFLKSDGYCDSSEDNRLNVLSIKAIGCLERFIERRSIRNAERETIATETEGPAEQPAEVPALREDQHPFEGHRVV